MTTTSQSYSEPLAQVTLHAAAVNDIEIAYRLAGRPDAPVLVLLHGFPGSSATYEPLMRCLGSRWRVIAPDYPGFGRSATPDPDQFGYTFARLASVIDDFLAVLGIDPFALYMFDFGAPVGMRLAVHRPDRITALVSQNGNVYADGLGPGITALRGYWADRTSVEPRLRTGLFTAAGVELQHKAGAVHPDRIDPDAVREAADQLADAARQQAVLDLLHDYRNNLDHYASWQAWLREHRPPLLAVWGAHDPIFNADGARAFTRDVPQAEVVLLEAGHFAALEATLAVAGHVDGFLSRALGNVK